MGVGTKEIISDKKLFHGLDYDVMARSDLFWCPTIGMNPCIIPSNPPWPRHEALLSGYEVRGHWPVGLAVDPEAFNNAENPSKPKTWPVRNVFNNKRLR